MCFNLSIQIVERVIKVEYMVCGGTELLNRSLLQDQDHVLLFESALSVIRSRQQQYDNNDVDNGVENLVPLREDDVQGLAEDFKLHPERYKNNPIRFA